MKFKRSERLIDMTHYLLDHPRELVPLTYFADKYGSAKSSISEDLGIIKETFEARGIGVLQTVSGAAGGVKFHVQVTDEEALKLIDQLCSIFADSDRLLPGGYLYLNDILGDPKIVKAVGRVIASAYANAEIDAVMTVATKGISIAYAVAGHLNVPVVIVRRDPKVTEGSTVSINYVSGSTKRIQTMVLSKRSISEGSKVLIVDDFMKAGGTINGMIDLLQEFSATVAGIAVLVESEEIEERLVDDYLSLVRLSDVNVKEKKISVSQGNFFTIKNKGSV
ncbi:pur operon repressor [Mesobacillus maritimus]|uniref:pur operon repressor n=1 Tax=Mesobacillus maritimus TaxID=1643336 RepID=UPI0020426A64|nr:pur operon repressor [Mesobacillus maritimus]MCM3588572.1 pur operon repressor [Mesobacillus maritimus]MCM3671589.1 pur operon repressor [Mesobacillus maritimus]